MSESDRRRAPRFNFRIPLSFHRKGLPSADEHRANSINVSVAGVSFVTTLPLPIGEALEVQMEIPKRVTGFKSLSRRFTGRVIHAESKHTPKGESAIGVQLLYYDTQIYPTPD
jgi:hypothetical protein